MNPVYIDWSQWEMPAKPAKGFWGELSEKDGGSHRRRGGGVVTCKGV